ncbi:hypothetical protein CK203_111112 [Vitis vinifera]|uniref:Uncharacterized protein n=1 Tax=Vitis vinifera TaxID=29760 RepID=A0A438BP72_VITVI|nr:hypothetical protein CK203_111112 [Vitis vinifera]
MVAQTGLRNNPSQEQLPKRRRSSGDPVHIGRMFPDNDKTDNKDLVLWPGLSSTGLLGTGIHGPSFHSSAKNQAWLDNATGTTGPSSFGNGVSTKKVSRVTVHKKQSWKRCAAQMFT